VWTVLIHPPCVQTLHRTSFAHCTIPTRPVCTRKVTKLIWYDAASPLQIHICNCIHIRTQSTRRVRILYYGHMGWHKCPSRQGGGSGPHLTRGFLGAHESTSQAASRPVQLFLQGSLTAVANTQTYTKIALRSTYAAIGRIYVVHALRPKMSLDQRAFSRAHTFATPECRYVGRVLISFS